MSTKDEKANEKCSDFDNYNSRSANKKQFDEMSEYLEWDMDFFKIFYATERNEISNNAEALAEMKAVGENICIDGGMTKLMIYHGEHGWKYEE